MSSIASSPGLENPWLNDDGSVGSAFSSPGNSPQKAKRNDESIKKRSSDVAGFEEGYSPQKRSPFSSPGSSPHKKQRTSSFGALLDTAAIAIPKVANRVTRRSLDFTSFRDNFFNISKFSPPGQLAINDDELMPVEMELEAEIKMLFRKDLTGKELSAVRFSQYSISSETKDGLRFVDIVHTLAKNGWDRGKAPMTVVTMADGKLTSLDNRRLYCVKECINKKKPRLVVPVNIYDHKASADPSYLTEIASQVRRVGAAVLGAMPREIVPDSWGYCVWARMRVFNQIVVAPESYGFTELPRIQE